VPERTAKRLLNALAAWPRGKKQALIAVVDALLLPFSIWVAFALRMGDFWPEGIADLWWLFPSVALVGVPILASVGLYREVTRHAGPRIVVQAVQGVGITALAVAAMILLSRDWAPRSLPVIFAIVAVGLVAGSRAVAKHALRTATGGERRRVIVWGSGDPAARLIQSLVAGSEYRPVAILDDDIRHRGSRVRGVPVRHTRDIDAIVRDEDVTHVFLAIPEATRAQRRAILERITALPVIVRSVASIDEVLSGRATWAETREVNVDDLLGREPVPPDQDLLARCVRGKSVLVTGGGGSIGGQLCREAIALSPTRLVVLERSEHALYQIEQDLRAIAPNAEIVPLLGSVLDRDRLEQAMRAFQVETVYHAAAFKHVPMVEHNVAEGVENNALGTFVTAEAAIASGVATFVLISTDKAVRPTSVMGASKRLAELVLQSLSNEGGATLFSMVRFGNVLGSSGSVVPLFRDQIARGGPVTVTHRDMIRYFMTIPEAAQLVMQAGAMADGGDVFLLDMGEPVRIADLAERMIRLAGKTVLDPVTGKGEIEIVYSGLRPGEKLFEELLIDATAAATGHPRISRANERSVPWDVLRPALEQLGHDCRANNVGAILATLEHFVPEYRRPVEQADILANRSGESADSTSSVRS
jgi:FlaA1/EpsC-like NDP-sugar epimerase